MTKQKQGLKKRVRARMEKTGERYTAALHRLDQPIPLAAVGGTLPLPRVGSATWNHAKKELFIKIVYYGPGASGKTTNLEFIHSKAPADQRGAKKTLNTSKAQNTWKEPETEATLFFDYFPLEVGEVDGFKVKLQIFTVPGRVFYNQVRKLVLKGATGIVFVADSRSECMEENKAALENLKENILATENAELDLIPLVYQWNKRDLPPGTLTPVEELEAVLNPLGLPSFCASATKGEGVFETLKAIAQASIEGIRHAHLDSV